jgi:hypothetical protein
MMPHTAALEPMLEPHSVLRHRSCTLCDCTGNRDKPRATSTDKHSPASRIDRLLSRCAPMLQPVSDLCPLVVGTFVGSFIQFRACWERAGNSLLLGAAKCGTGPTTWEEIAGWSKAALRLPCTRAPVCPQPAARYPLRPTFSDGSVSVGNQLCTVRWGSATAHLHDHLSG